MDCNKTKIFLEELDRMCRYYSITQNNEGEERCKNCPISIANNGRDVSCTNFPTKYPQEAIEIVQKWSDEHPIKTRQSEFLKMFPEAAMSDDVIFICPRQVDMSFTCRNASQYCYECKKGYWFSEVE